MFSRLIAVFVFVFAFAAHVHADVANGRPVFSWTQPPTWSDGTALTAAQITGYQLACSGAQPVSARLAASSSVPPATYPIAPTAPLTPGAYQCTLAVYARQSSSVAEVLGAASAPVSFTVPAPRPVAATGLSVD